MAGEWNAKLAGARKNGCKARQRHDPLRTGKINADHALPKEFLCKFHRQQVLGFICFFGTDAHGAQQNAGLD